MKKIMIIEDDPIIAHIYRTRLERESFQVEISGDGQSGFYRAFDYNPDAILLDLMLPKMNGIELLKKMRAETRFASLPILVFTNAYVPNMIQEAFGAGASQVFNKATLTPRSIIDALQQSLVAAQKAAAVAPSAPAPAAPSPAPVSVAPLPAASAPPTTGALPNAAAVVAAAGSDDSNLSSELLKAFQQSASDMFSALRKSMQDLSKAPDETSRLTCLLDLYRKVHSLAGSAGLATLKHVAQVSAALEVLLKELHDKPKNVNASTLRTVAHCIDFIGELLKSSESNEIDSAPFNILVVDDEILSRRAITYALEKANLKSVSVEDPQVAWNLAKDTAFDLVFLDIQMPGMDGFDLCTKIHASPRNKSTPIIFVTSLTDFKSRAKSSLSGGADLIAKPFMFIELSVKALTYVMRGRLVKTKAAAA